MLSEDISIEELAKMTEGYTGADLQALLHNAQLEVVHEIIDNRTASLSNSNISLSLPFYTITISHPPPSIRFLD